MRYATLGCLAALLLPILLLVGCEDGLDEDKAPVYTEADCVEYSVNNALGTVQCPDGSLMGDKL